jgi:hypothetical protein
LRLHRTASRSSLQRQNAVGEIDLSRLIAAAKVGTVLDETYLFEIHEQTAADDPIVLVDVDRVTVPPSQNPDHLMYLGIENAVTRHPNHGV